MTFLDKRVGAASRHHHKIIDVLYPKRPDSQVTPLGAYTAKGKHDTGCLRRRDRPRSKFLCTCGIPDADLCFCHIEHPDSAKLNAEFCPLHGTHPLSYAEAMRL